MLIKRLYESYVLEKLPEKRYEALSAEYEHEQAELEEAIAQDQAKLDAYQADSTNVEAFIQLAKKYRDVPELTPEQQAEQDKIMKKCAMYRKKYLRRKELKAEREAAAAQAEEEPEQDTKKSA